MKTSLRMFALVASLSLISVPAHSTTFTAELLGANEWPVPVATPASGFITVELFPFLHILSVDVTYEDLIGGTVSGAHIHCCVGPSSTAPVAIGMLGFPVSASGTFGADFNLLDSSIYGVTFFANSGGTAALAEAALIAALFDGSAYFNIHTTPDFPAGEIRGQLAAKVPEPESLVLFTLALFGLSFLRRLKSFAQTR